MLCCYFCTCHKITPSRDCREVKKREALKEKIFKTQLSAAILIMENLITKLDKVGLEDRVEEAKEDGQFKWGMDLFEIYKLSLKFYKGKKN